jgi:hypothetical protein
LSNERIKTKYTSVVIVDVYIFQGLALKFALLLKGQTNDWYIATFFGGLLHDPAVYLTSHATLKDKSAISRALCLKNRSFLTFDQWSLYLAWEGGGRILSKGHMGKKYDKMKKKKKGKEKGKKLKRKGGKRKIQDNFLSLKQCFGS